MDNHTLELLEFDKIRALVAARAACSLGKQAAMGIEPTTEHAEAHGRLALTTEMVEAISSGLHPPFGGLHDIRPHVRRAQIGAMLETEDLAETVETLRALGASTSGSPGSATSSPGWEACARAWASSPAWRPPSRAASTPGARCSTRRAAGSRCCGAISARSRSGSRRPCGGWSARPS